MKFIQNYHNEHTKIEFGMLIVVILYELHTSHFAVYGTPEYGCGGLAFPDFLAIKSEEQTKNFYQLCSNIVLERQVGIVDILYQHPMHYNN